MLKHLLLLISANVLVCLSQNISNCTDDGYVSSGIYCDECGLSDVTPNVRIVGGIEALPSSWPAQVLVIQNIKGNFLYPNNQYYTISKEYMCGGTLINRFTVLTAAHCVNSYFETDYNGQPLTFNTYPTSYYPTLESTFTVYLGIFDISAISKGVKPPAIAVSVQKAIRHELYDSEKELNDIALLILNSSVETNSYIKPACLPKSSVNYPSANTTVYAAGWGTQSYQGSPSNTLFNVNLFVYSPSWCRNVYPTVTKNWNAQICAGNYSGYEDTCQGDSGGGVYVLDTIGNKARYVVSGITSYGDGCATFSKPGIYTRVSYYVDWIQKNMGNYNATSLYSLQTTLNSSCKVIKTDGSTTTLIFILIAFIQKLFITLM